MNYINTNIHTRISVSYFMLLSLRESNRVKITTTDPGAPFPWRVFLTTSYAPSF